MHWTINYRRLSVGICSLFQVNQRHAFRTPWHLNSSPSVQSPPGRADCHRVLTQPFPRRWSTGHPPLAPSRALPLWGCSTVTNRVPGVLKLKLIALFRKHVRMKLSSPAVSAGALPGTNTPGYCQATAGAPGSATGPLQALTTKLLPIRCHYKPPSRPASSPAKLWRAGRPAGVSPPHRADTYRVSAAQTRRPGRSPSAPAAAQLSAGGRAAALPRGGGGRRGRPSAPSRPPPASAAARPARRLTPGGRAGGGARWLRSCEEAVGSSRRRPPISAARCQRRGHGGRAGGRRLCWKPAWRQVSWALPAARGAARTAGAAFQQGDTAQRSSSPGEVAEVRTASQAAEASHVLTPPTFAFFLNRGISGWKHPCLKFSSTRIRGKFKQTSIILSWVIWKLM